MRDSCFIFRKLILLFFFFWFIIGCSNTESKLGIHSDCCDSKESKLHYWGKCAECSCEVFTHPQYIAEEYVPGYYKCRTSGCGHMFAAHNDTD